MSRTDAALAEVLLAWHEWPGGDDGGPFAGAMRSVGSALIEAGLADSRNRLTSGGEALLADLGDLDG